MGVLGRRRGLTLPEVLVAMAIFAGMLVVVVGLQLTTQRAYRQAETRDEDFRQAMLASGHVQALLQGVQVSAAQPASPGLDLLVPRRQNGQVVLDGSGRPLLDPVQIRLDPDGSLVRLDNGIKRPLARLGAAGQAQFVWEPARPGLLHVTLKAARTAQVTGYLCDFQVYLPNQLR